MSEVMDRAMALVNDAEAEIERLAAKKEELDGEMRTLRAFVRAVSGPSPKPSKKEARPGGTRISPQRALMIGEGILQMAPMGDFNARQARQHPSLADVPEGAFYAAVERLHEIGFLRSTGKHKFEGRTMNHYAIMDRAALDSLRNEVNGD